MLSSRDPGLGVAAADAIRERIQNDHSATDLYVVPKPTVDRTLALSGFSPDSVLSTDDLIVLAKQVRGDYALAGTVERTASGVRTSVRLVTQAGPLTLEEPLAPIVGADFGEIAKQVDRAVSDAIRALGFYQDCRKSAMVGDYRQAMAVAQRGLELRPTSAALHACVLTVLTATHATPDSIIAVASAITAIDSTSVAAWANLADAYLQKSDTSRAVGAMRTLHEVQPTNVAVTSTLVDLLVSTNQSDSALAMLEHALRTAPPTTALLRKRWLLQLRLGQYPAALASGAALIAADSTTATEDYYERQLVAANGAKDSVALHRIALDGSTRFPRNPDFLLVLARDAVDRGAAREGLAFAQRALALEPANSLAWQLAIAAAASADGIDSAVATARRALAASVPAEAVGKSLVALVGPGVAAAQKSGKREDWESALRDAQAVDAVASSALSNFYIGVAAYQIAMTEVQPLAEFARRSAPTAAQRQTACESAKRADDLFNTVAIAMPKGGSVDPAVASRILGSMSDYASFVSSAKRASCR